jgi:hypothetical protein
MHLHGDAIESRKAEKTWFLSAIAFSYLEFRTFCGVWRDLHGIAGLKRDYKTPQTARTFEF